MLFFLFLFFAESYASSPVFPDEVILDRNGELDCRIAVEIVFNEPFNYLIGSYAFKKSSLQKA